MEMEDNSRNLEMISDEDLSDSEDISVRKISSASAGGMTHPGLDFTSSLFHVSDDKRAHHNALERKRRDHIKDSFTLLKDVVPSLKNEKASRATILRKSADYIQFVRGRNKQHEKDIAEIKRQNAAIESEIRAIEEARGLSISELDVEEEMSADADDRIDFLSLSDPNLAQNQFPVITTSSIGQSVSGMASRKWSAPARYIAAEELLKQQAISQFQQQHRRQAAIAEVRASIEDNGELSGSDSTVSICDI